MGCRTGSVRMSYLENPRVVQFLKAANRPITDVEADKAVDGIAFPLLGNIMVPNFVYRSWVNRMVVRSCEHDPVVTGTIYVHDAHHIEYHGRFDVWLETSEGEAMGRDVFAEITNIAKLFTIPRDLIEGENVVRLPTLDILPQKAQM